jgi:hypothetical protein
MIWVGRNVSDAALTTRLNATRTAIGDSGEEQRLIKTLVVSSQEVRKRRTSEKRRRSVHACSATGILPRRAAASSASWSRSVCSR